MSDPMISMQGLSKQYTLGGSGGGYGRLTESVSNAVRGVLRRPDDSGHQLERGRTFWALRNVSADIGHGEVVGVIGRNGAGKTTLLKVLSRITAPTEGEAVLHGRVGCLLEVGTGFHPELSGAENIYLNGAILGMPRKELRGKFDDIVDFAEIGEFIDTPVKRYSSGMYVRLAFAVAAFLEPEILIVDEVLAVGDAAFQRKCLGKMDDVAQSGRTVLFVSHNMGAVRALCTRGIVLERGETIFDGPAGEAIDNYQSRVYDTSASRTVLEPNEDVPIQVTELWVENEHGEPTAETEMGRPATLVVDYVVRRSLRDVTIAVMVTGGGTPLLYTYDTDADESLRHTREPARYRARVPLPLDLFKEGLYNVAASIGWASENVTDPNATVNLTIVNHERDTTHRSYRIDRPGALFRELRWETERLGD